MRFMLPEQQAEAGRGGSRGGARACGPQETAGLTGDPGQLLPVLAGG